MYLLFRILLPLNLNPMAKGPLNIVPMVKVSLNPNQNPPGKGGQGQGQVPQVPLLGHGGPLDG